MKFENNRLMPIKPVRHKRKFIVYDIETTNWNQFLMAGVYNGKEYVFCENLDKLVNELIRKKYANYYIYAHYGGGFDHRFILDYIMRHKENYHVTIIENHGNIMQLKIQNPNRKKTWYFLDSYQVIKGNLKDLTVTFDVEHKKLDTERRNMTDTPETRKYLENDCKGLYEVIEKFYASPILEGVDHKMTTSSLTMTVFRQNYLNDTVLYKLPPDKEDFVRKGYYGGRTEIFKLKAGDEGIIREYDVNSMYVSAMLKPLPYGVGSWANNFTFRENMCAFMEVEAECPAGLHIPLLPYRNKDKLIFPAGKFTGVYFSAEIEEAIKLGYKVKVLRCLVFPASNYLAEFASDVWRVRQENPGRNPLNITAKLLGNGLYGKFAQRRDRTILKQLDFEEGCKNKYEIVFPEFDLWRVPTHSDSAAILPHISAAITSYSRIALHRFLNVFPEDVCYCDTDSVFIEGRKLEHSEKLGELKFENEFKRFIAIQPKFYLAEYVKPKREWRPYEADIFGTKLKYQVKSTIKQKLRAKGFQVDEQVDELDWNYDTFAQALAMNDYAPFFQTMPQKLTKLNEAIRKKDFLALVMRKRSVKSEYDKRIVNRRDWTTRPIILQGGTNEN